MVPVWQGGGCGRREDDLSVVLCEVFTWLEGCELARAGAVCRAWRAAALDPALWRDLLRPLAPPGALRNLVIHNANCGGILDWRAEYTRVCARWTPRGRLTAHAPLLHAALSASANRLATAAEDATITVWERTEAGMWEQRWNVDMRARGWAATARAEWAPRADDRLLAAGPLALADRWELAVLTLHEQRGLVVASRAGCSAGGAGCWAGARAFLSLELRRLAPRHAATTVWLNAASQETESEYAGVTTPLLRIYNEASANISHALVADVPLDADTESDLIDHDADTEVVPGAPYYRATCEPRVADASLMLLVAGCGSAGGARGEASALCAWPLSAVAPPPLLATSTLPERAARRRAEILRALEPEPEPEEPDERAVRALCTPPDAVCRLHARLLGLALHPSGRCVWASGAGGRMTCASLPALRPLCTLAAPGQRPAAHLVHHYVQPAAGDSLVGSPAGGGAGSVWLWSAASGACPPTPLTHAAPALALLLPPARAHTFTALVLTPDAIYVWTSRAPPS